MRLTGCHHSRKKDGSNTTSSRTSPSKHQDSDSLLFSAESFLLHEEVKNQARTADSASTVHHPVMKTPADDENLDCDSNASSSSFEFPNGERCRARQLSRSASSKWNDAEKWIMTRPAHHQSCRTKSVIGHSQMSRRLFPMTRADRMSETKGSVDFCQPPSQAAADLDKSAVRTVSMRDMGTEMTPLASQDPSTASTPIGATTPTVSIPSTPGREDPDPAATEQKKKIVSETRREIIALGVQLGKKNITAWASQQDKEQCGTVGVSEYERRAAAWEQVEKTKHEARCRREHVMIQVWESRQKAKLEAEMRSVEAKVEEMRCQCQAKMLQKIATVSHRSEEKRAKAEARKNHQAHKMSGYIPYMCCGWACP